MGVTDADFGVVRKKYKKFDSPETLLADMGATDADFAKGGRDSDEDESSVSTAPSDDDAAFQKTFTAMRQQAQASNAVQDAEEKDPASPSAAPTAPPKWDDTLPSDGEDEGTFDFSGVTQHFKVRTDLRPDQYTVYDSPLVCA